MLKKIAVCGLNDEKRTTLAKYLAHHLKTYCVPDYQKEYSEMVKRVLTSLDYKKISRGMQHLAEEYAAITKETLIFDNNIVQLYVEAKLKFDAPPNAINKEEISTIFDLFVITEAQNSNFSKTLEAIINNNAPFIYVKESMRKEDLLKLVQVS